MTTHSPTSYTTLAAAAPQDWLHDARTPAIARKVLPLLRHLRHGTLELTLPHGYTLHFGQTHASETDPNPIHAKLHLQQWSVLQATLRSGDIGFAEGYMAGHWSSPDLAALITLLARNRQILDGLIYGRWWGRLLYRLRHLLRHNSKANSRKNIHTHYDLGNDFYSLWLDGSMNYSSAWFAGNYHQDLSSAQNAKVHRALQELDLRPGQRLLEIGCGWGAVAQAATEHYQAHAVGVTLSTEQLAYAQQRLHNAGISCGPNQQADLRLQDYRDISDPAFDAICSIEMIEAVGQAYWPTYFGSLQRLLKPGGKACIQSIVIADGLFDRYLQGTDFIQQYIFPGGCLPSPSALQQQAQAAGLRVQRTLAFGLDYAETLRRWRERFMQQLPAVRALGFDDTFIRLWEFYLVYCEAAFVAGDIDVLQITLEKPCP
ncbi:class I SAM-dependent methyltransferase [Curvibacter sp. CHRR-16]|uniref:SAM-dependent methyltransferase n=1 Tax=Curvibacter sp. CHRR-16 TaxID=2835872 RepID=UPI001BD94E99|nr:cyclopropane-fatty-acyl-phospholipid synthase family protein [Curvibacter sp. CHRR-16]MBT0569343.1 class I SAM-dependent methyltransferase [Curvibacter sp. CHRR-16]